ncbi:zinc-binding dehydrogenase [Cryobacterium sp. Y57]|uniref:zinc-binding dehydrogenase n=1 Tax=Cryobacterium sp. Y57 TaxID=2048287 RepID=UPI003519F41A
MAAPPTAVAVSSTWSAPARIIGINANPEKLTLARNLGATGAYSSGEAEELGIHAHVVIEAAGHPRTFETAVRSTAAGGTTVTVGLPAPGAMSSIDPLRNLPRRPEPSSGPILDRRCPAVISRSTRRCGAKEDCRSKS